MKLRNKKTGNIVEAETLNLLWKPQTEFSVDMRKPYDSLAKLNEDWEDYKPKEPKITNPEWCHVVRKWYDLNHLEGELSVRVSFKNCVTITGWRKDDMMYGQEINIPLSVMECDETSHYTIDELCGEGEE